jgi:putative RNA 2'-phosphotransferase
MNDKQRVRTSMYLSLHLRHQPEALGLTLGPGGWVEIETLLKACVDHGFAITRADLEEVVARCDKQRFALDETGTRIRANQGHSAEVDLQLEPVVPPDVLYHGTAADSVAAIRQSGLQRMARHHVHLSATPATAQNVGGRHGKPVVLVVDAAAMYRDGFVFYCSANGVWLTDEVPAQYLRDL